MEENKLVPKENDKVAFDDEIYGVRVERSKRKKKKKSRLKRLIVIACIACLLVVIIKNFNSIGDLFSSLFISSDGNNPPLSNSGSDDLKNDFNDKNEQVEDNNQSYDYNFIDTVPTEFAIIDKNLIINDIGSLSFTPPKSKDVYDAYGESSPVVLIVNFSPLECYSDGYGYSSTSTFYSYEQNVSDLSEQICESLNSLGINAIHLKKDYGNASLLEYQKEYVKDIENLLESNPSICYIFDISRGLTINSDMSINCERTEINGNSIPTLSFICGTEGESTTEIQNRSIYFAYDLATSINESAPHLVSTLTLAELDLNHRFKSPCIRVEIGSFANTFEDASLTADYLALSLSSYLK